METNTILLIVLIALLFLLVVVAFIIAQRLQRDDKFFDARWRIYQKEGEDERSEEVKK